MRESTDAAAQPEDLAIIIRPSRGWALPSFRELWDRREILYFLIWRGIKVRYKQTLLGATWAILQPFLAMVVFSILFGRLAGIPSDGLPYPIFAYAALVPWQFFVSAITESSNSLVQNQNLITKVYFPRLAIPISAVLTGLIDFGIAFFVLLGMMLYYGILPTLAILWLPLFLLLAIATALAVGLWFSALNVEYRDIRHGIAFLIQFWFYATPVVYPSSLIPEPWRTWYGLNPMAGVIEGFRMSLLGTGNGPNGMLIVSIIVVMVLLFGGLIYFRRMERTFADVI